MGFVVRLAKSRGMCAGVERAISTVLKVIERYHGEKIYVLHEVVHNKHVVADLSSAGAVFVEDLNDVPQGAVLIFSAHGVGVDTVHAAKEKNLRIIDATCPVVTAIHHKVNKASRANQEVVVIGHKGHQEVVGTIGQYEGNLENIKVILKEEEVNSLILKNEESACFTTQTTLSVEETRNTVLALKKKYPKIKGPKADDTCRATQVRQQAIIELSKLCDLILIAGSSNSSNSNRLREIAIKHGTPAYLVDDESEISEEWIKGKRIVGLSAGASAPQYVVDDIIAFLKQKGATEIIETGTELQERSFPLPNI